MKRPVLRSIVAAVALVSAAISTLGISRARAAEPRATSLTPIRDLQRRYVPEGLRAGNGGMRSAIVSSSCRDHDHRAPRYACRAAATTNTLRRSWWHDAAVVDLHQRRRGYALVGTSSTMSLYVTHDGAGNWHKVPAMSGVSFQRITVTGRVVYATMAKCKGFDDDCVDLTMAKSALWPIHWTALRLPSIPNNGLDGGIPEVIGRRIDRMALGSRTTPKSSGDPRTRERRFTRRPNREWSASMGVALNSSFQETHGRSARRACWCRSSTRATGERIG